MRVSASILNNRDEVVLYTFGKSLEEIEEKVEAFLGKIRWNVYKKTGYRIVEIEEDILDLDIYDLEASNGSS